MIVALKDFKLSRSIPSNPSMDDSDSDEPEIVNPRKDIEEMVEIQLEFVDSDMEEEDFESELDEN